LSWPRKSEETGKAETTRIRDVIILFMDKTRAGGNKGTKGVLRWAIIEAAFM
jgi:hypothetical protein